MSDPTAPPEQAPAEGNGCPITAEFLPANMRKHVDPLAPVPLRMMAAKGLVPLAPADMLGALFMLMYDADPAVRETTAKTAATLPDRMVAPAFRDEGVQGPVLGWFLETFAAKEQYAEILILNPSTPDDAVARVAPTCTKRVAEIIGQNQLRLLRYDHIIRELAQNPEAQGALIDGVCDFAVRSGVRLPDVPQMQEARVRLYGPEVAAAPPEPEGPTAEEIMQEMEADPAAVNAAGQAQDSKSMRLSQRILKMTVSEKIKLANQGNKEARTLLIRDSNKLVVTAVMRSPRLTDGEVLNQAQNKVAAEEVLRIICNNREWLRQYPVKLALVKNPKVPQAVSMRLLNQLHEADVKSLARDKNVPGTVQMLARKMGQKKEEKEKGAANH